jgi:hypothetical protein
MHALAYKHAHDRIEIQAYMDLFTQAHTQEYTHQENTHLFCCCRNAQMNRNDTPGISRKCRERKLAPDKLNGKRNTFAVSMEAFQACVSKQDAHKRVCVLSWVRIPDLSATI